MEYRYYTSGDDKYSKGFLNVKSCLVACGYLDGIFAVLNIDDTAMTRIIVIEFRCGVIFCL